MIMLLLPSKLSAFFFFTIRLLVHAVHADKIWHSYQQETRKEDVMQRNDLLLKQCYWSHSYKREIFENTSKNVLFT